ncbi:hypothetical protein HK103_006701 [Boothiomyces macroporosus]|uniref:D-isomer specific 2-hydroxyacid dehydrogenase NAD-binding domain-containing protein n=1 Tax=Boothiomyces macroporosus TaxID=261099 RepID=A0AAD5UGL4_9FUNG|nr:hypothetical protein HK103_006701 [Boothiomyces macroporosus]
MTMNQVVFLSIDYSHLRLLFKSFKELFLSQYPSFTVHFHSDKVPPEVDPDTVEIVVTATVPPNQLLHYKNVKLIASLWAGVDGILNDPSFKQLRTSNKQLILTRLVDPDMKKSLAESCLARVLYIYRHFNKYQEQQQTSTWYQHIEFDKSDCKIGILGMGEIGYECAKYLVRNGFIVYGHTRSPKTVKIKILDDDENIKEIEISTFTGEDGIKQLCSNSDILVNLLPLTPATENILNASFFKMMKKGSKLINFARGGHLVEQDLLDALDNHLDLAVLDVFRKEPLTKDSPLWTHPRVIITPHVAALTDPKTGPSIVMKSISAFIGGTDIPNRVNLDLGY